MAATKHLASVAGVLWAAYSSAACNTLDSATERGDQTAPLPSSTAPTPMRVQCGATADNDGDGWFATIAEFCRPDYLVDPSVEDCDDTDPARNEPLFLYADADGDGFGTSVPAEFWWVCVGDTREGFVPNQSDCDDASSDGHEFVWRDDDGDGFGTGAVVCGAAGEGWSSQSGDCRDDDAEFNPVRDEVAFDESDSNCDGVDAPRYAANATVRWEAPLCSGAVLGIVGFSEDGSGLYVANIGTNDVVDATLVVRELGAADIIVETRSYLLPALKPGETTLAGALPVRSHQARFEYTNETHEFDPASSSESVQSNEDTAMRVRDAGSDGGSPDASGDAGSVRIVDDASVSSFELDGELCERAKLPLLFSNSFPIR